MHRGLLIFCVFVSCFLVVPRAEGQTQMTDVEVVGPMVFDALETQDRVRVIAVFELPTSRSTLQGLDTPVARAEIKAVGQAILSDLGSDEFELRHRFESINALAGEVTRNGLQKLLANPSVVRVDLDEGGTGLLAEAAPLANIDDVQALGLTGAEITVGVLDSGYDTDHPDLSDDLDGEQCFCSGNGGCCPDGTSNQSGSGSAEDDHGHGTNVSGIITSAGTVAPLGGAPDAEIVAVKVLDSNNSFCCSSDIVAGLNWIINNRPDVDIVNMSLGTYALFTGNCDNAFFFNDTATTEIYTLRTNGVAVFVSSGNNGSGTQMTAPACVANAISVGAIWDSNVGSQTVFGCTDSTTMADHVTCFSNSNATTDLFAPGAPTTSTGMGGGMSSFFGTSQASPLTAACAALLLDNDPTLTPNDIEMALEDSPTLVTDVTNGLSFPRLDCLYALLADQPPLVAGFTAFPSSGVAPLTVDFINQSTGYITSWDWDFGDGLTGSEQNPSHTFTELGTYTVSLTVTGPQGSDTETKTAFIKVSIGLKAMPWIPLLLLDD
jgi:PKD repeat protein